MIFFLDLYKWALLAGILTGAALAILGAHLATRDQLVQSLCMSEGAMVGVLVGVSLSESGFAPFALGITASVLTFILTRSARTPALISGFIGLLALGFGLSAVLPGLESHLAQTFFGDLVTISDAEAFSALGISLVSLALLVCFSNPISKQSFEIAIYGKTFAGRNSRRFQLLFQALTAVLISISIQGFGLVFTLGCLAIPTTVLAGARKPGLKRHLVLVSLLAAFGTAAGFLASLMTPLLPTTPVVIATVIFVGLLAKVLF